MSIHYFFLPAKGASKDTFKAVYRTRDLCNPKQNLLQITSCRPQTQFDLSLDYSAFEQQLATNFSPPLTSVDLGNPSNSYGLEYIDKEVTSSLLLTAHNGLTTFKPPQQGDYRLAIQYGGLLKQNVWVSVMCDAQVEDPFVSLTSYIQHTLSKQGLPVRNSFSNQIPQMLRAGQPLPHVPYNSLEQLVV